MTAFNFESSNLDLVLLAEFDAWTGTKVERQYFASAGYRTLPTEYPASVAYMPCLTGNPVFRASIAESLSGFSDISWGYLEIDNSHEQYDGMVDWSFDGRRIDLYVGDRSWPRSQFKRCLRGNMQRLSVQTDGMLRLHIRDNQTVLDTPISEAKVAEGGAINATGPVTFGVVNGIAPLREEADTLGNGIIFRVHDGEIDAINDVYDNGVAFAFGADRADRTALVAAAPAAGTYDTCLAEGLFKLGGGEPAGVVTVDMRGDKPGGTYTEYAGAIARNILINRGGITADQIDDAALDALDSTYNYNQGYYGDGSDNILDVLDEFFGSIRAWYGFSRFGKFTCGRIDTAPGTPLLELGEHNTEGLIGVEIIDRVAWRERIGYKKNWNPIPWENLAGAAQTDANSDWHGSVYRYVVAEDAGIKQSHVLAMDRPASETLMTREVDAQIECDNRLAFDRDHRFVYRVTANAEPFFIDLGDTVRLTDRRYGLSVGKVGKVTSVREHFLETTVELKIFV